MVLVWYMYGTCFANMYHRALPLFTGLPAIYGTRVHVFCTQHVFEIICSKVCILRVFFLSLQIRVLAEEIPLLSLAKNDKKLQQNEYEKINLFTH